MTSSLLYLISFPASAQYIDLTEFLSKKRPHLVKKHAHLVTLLVLGNPNQEPFSKMPDYTLVIY